MPAITKDSLSWTRLTLKPDPAHGSPCARSSHGVSLVNEDTLVVLGGEHVARTPIEGTDRYWMADLKNSAWKAITASNPPPDRIAHAQAVHNGCIYIFGGRAGITMDEQAMNDLWKLDIAKNEWIEVKAKSGTPPEARSFHRMICIGDSLYVFGGCTAGHGRASDLHQFNLTSQSWHNWGTSGLRGRGGPNLMALDGGKLIGVVAGFAGEETNDGHIFNVETNKWWEFLLEKDLKDMRPRSVCVCGSFPSVGCSLIFGGEVDPSDRGHEGAGAFENDIVVLDENTGLYISTIPKGEEEEWPQTRGWSDSDSLDNGNGTGKFYIFGGLSGDDKNPERLDDLWVLTITK